MSKNFWLGFSSTSHRNYSTAHKQRGFFYTLGLETEIKCTKVIQPEVHWTQLTACCYHRGEVLHPPALSDASSGIHPTFQWGYLTWKKPIIQMCCWLCVVFCQYWPSENLNNCQRWGAASSRKSSWDAAKGMGSSDPAIKKQYTVEDWLNWRTLVKNTCRL